MPSCGCEVQGLTSWCVILRSVLTISEDAEGSKLREVMISKDVSALQSMYGGAFNTTAESLLARK